MSKRLRRVLKWIATAFALVLVLAALALAVAWWRSDNDCAARAASTPANPMKAIVYCDYGAPEVLKVENIERPVPADTQVLVKVHAASVNPLDYHYMRGTPYIMRLDGGLKKPKVTRLGVDFAGTVVEAGKNATQFKPGDEVFGGRTGAFAEYIAIREESLVMKPANMTFEQAAAVPIAAVTALQALRDKGKVRPGQKVLINGASGGVGTFAVQIAKSLGAHVTGVCSTRNVALVKSLGADAVIDYTQQDYTAMEQQYDVIVDMVGNHALSANKRVLVPNGIYVMVGGPKGRWLAPIDRVAQMALMSPFVKQEFGMVMAKLNREDLTILRDLMQAGKVTPVIDRRYSLREVPEAIRYLETGRARGKVVIQVAE
jgi:NADPH:quinone reductase-like Zn-dependent oxidoreductase